ncbi:nuclear transport factor 2 family protein [Rhodococcus oxybenzonivorans]|uniref:nuclear transport factor 2 family protein n=1 Tax=Rhodococcus oxybenzonivorans TaxID=1990687 RepID=UPI00295549CD|nr:nuclear transport factor 2 family protein [Rhodococcus oxybenzonivorans]MDV7353682.1 nuclear transport factor 2 family protein [Rhodococcus oxybenzonivorans]
MTQTTFDYTAAATDFYRELDANDPGVFDRRLTTDAEFVFNNLDPVTGRDAIGKFIGDWKANFTSVTHEIIETTVDPVKQIIGVEVVVAYTFTDGKIVKLNGCSFLAFTDDRINSYRVYVDTTALA